MFSLKTTSKEDSQRRTGSVLRGRGSGLLSGWMRENTAEQVRHKLEPEMMAECERDPESRVCGSVGWGVRD